MDTVVADFIDFTLQASHVMTILYSDLLHYRIEKGLLQIFSSMDLIVHLYAQLINKFKLR